MLWAALSRPCLNPPSARQTLSPRVCRSVLNFLSARQRLHGVSVVPLWHPACFVSYRSRSMPSAQGPFAACLLHTLSASQLTTSETESNRKKKLVFRNVCLQESHELIQNVLAIHDLGSVALNMAQIRRIHGSLNPLLPLRLDSLGRRCWQECWCEYASKDT